MGYFIPNLSPVLLWTLFEMVLSAILSLFTFYHILLEFYRFQPIHIMDHPIIDNSKIHTYWNLLDNQPWSKHRQIVLVQYQLVFAGHTQVIRMVNG